MGRARGRGCVQCRAGYWEASLILEGEGREWRFGACACDEMRWVMVCTYILYTHRCMSASLLVVCSCSPAGTLFRLPGRADSVGLPVSMPCRGGPCRWGIRGIRRLGAQGEASGY
jgi:hypothetical protein